MSANKTGDALEEEDDSLPPLDFEAWATLSARLVRKRGPERATLLQSAGLDEGDWKEWDGRYTALLMDDVRSDRAERASLYGAKCEEEQARRRASAESPAANPPANVASARATPSSVASLVVAASPPTDPLTREQPAPSPPKPTSVAARPTMALPVFAGPPPGAGEQALPFKDGPASPIVASAGPSPSTPREMGETVPLSRAGTDAPLPFGVDAGVEMTVEQYASFRAELGVLPEEQGEIYARYGVESDKARRDLDERWRKRFAADRPAQARFITVSTQYRDYLLKQKGPQH